MITKQQIVDAINALPEDKFDNIDTVIEEIILLEKIEKGLQDIKEGKTMSAEEVDREIEKW